MKVNAKLVTRRKAEKSTGFITAQNGTRLDWEIPNGFQKVGAKSENLEEEMEAAKKYRCASSQ